MSNVQVLHQACHLDLESEHEMRDRDAIGTRQSRDKHAEFRRKVCRGDRARAGRAPTAFRQATVSRPARAALFDVSLHELHGYQRLRSRRALQIKRARAREGDDGGADFVLPGRVTRTGSAAPRPRTAGAIAARSRRHGERAVGLRVQTQNPEQVRVGVVLDEGCSFGDELEHRVGRVVGDQIERAAATRRCCAIRVPGRPGNLC